MMNFVPLEAKRLALQSDLDAEKSSRERNKLGQFATPTALAQDILRYGAALLGDREPIRFLDPAIGTGSFYSALRSVVPADRISEAQGFEIDPHYGKPGAEFWANTGLRITLGDFTKQDADPRFNLLICNPPYVRHHHMEAEEKNRLQLATLNACGSRIGGLAGLYCYFLGLSHAWLAPSAISGWLIPSEFMDVNYGQAVKRYLLDRVTLLHIHRFDPNDVQFADALVSSAVVWFRNEPPPRDHSVTFSFGGSLARPTLAKVVSSRALASESKWTRFPASEVRVRSNGPTVSDFFKIKRGIATGDNGFFILSAEEIETRGLPLTCFRPILPGPRYVKENEVRADLNGVPILDRKLFLLDPVMSESDIQARFPSLWSYLEEGKARGLHRRYLCSHRALWYAQERRPPAPIVCTYIGRGDAKSGRPFRFILNHSQATVANVYLAMYPTGFLQGLMARDPGLIRKIWLSLNAIAPDRLLGEGRVYGGGLHKLEPRELANVPVADLVDAIPDRSSPQGSMNFEAAD